MNFVVLPVPPQKIYPLRQSILRPDRSYEFSIYPADSIPTTLHLGAFLENELVGIASVYLESAPDNPKPNSWRLRDMGVVKGSRHRGCGRALLKSAIEYINSQRGSFFWCYARSTAIGFYQAHGFHLRDQAFELPGFGQRYFMWRDLG